MRKRRRRIAGIGGLIAACAVCVLFAVSRTETRLEDGNYRIEKFDGARMYVRSAESADAGQHIVEVPEDALISIYDLEPLLQMQVSATYEELQEFWTPDNVYSLHFYDGELVQIREYSAQDDSFSYLTEGDLGQAYYTVSPGEEDGQLVAVPVRYMESENAETADLPEEAETDPFADGGWTSIAYTDEAKTVYLQEDTRYYILTSYDASRSSWQEIEENGFCDGNTMRLLLDGDKVVCLVAYDAV